MARRFYLEIAKKTKLVYDKMLRISGNKEAS